MPTRTYDSPKRVAAAIEKRDRVVEAASRLLGARTDIADKLWNGTPLDWAIHLGKDRARARLDRWVADPGQLQSG